MTDRTLDKMIPTLSLLIFTERLKEEKALNAKDYVVAMASVIGLAKANGIDPDDLQKELTGVIGVA
jgi:hypothetical protein